jgi:hypothetical protein
LGPTTISAPRFHIRWSVKDLVDWQRFQTRQDAIRLASELARPGEICTVEEHSPDCPFCEQYKLAATA